MRIGIISDTHGLLRPEALQRLDGCDRILHAGDIGSAEVLAGLKKIAPLAAIKGNNDEGEPWAGKLPAARTIRLESGRIFLLHSRGDLDFDPSERGYRAVVSGHSHKPGIEEIGGILYINPGSAGPRRFSLPISLAMLEIRGRKWKASLVMLY
jgi:putative phosphoesterase